ncbi:hypothetical protein LE190_16030 [Massilia oculi]|uniref:Uncharacterized protein n=1 Tax=Massilia hydrophila TaxID=3044279 RepID=A0ABS7YEK2_9BURK|nr:hypothetical protein [Massilia oculi]MCA1857422.1 hypothetical protein [Massilia oculi]
MALYDPKLQHQAELDKLTREKAFMIQAAIKAGHPLNTKDMLGHLSTYLGDSQALAELMQQTLKGRNAFRELLDKLALEIGGQQATADLAPRSRRGAPHAGARSAAGAA